MSDITISAEQLRALLEAGSAGLDLSSADLIESSPRINPGDS